MRLPRAAVRKYNSLAVSVAVSILYGLFMYSYSRVDYGILLGLYVALFYLYYHSIAKSEITDKNLLRLSFLFRAVLILSIPNLSQDFYRFIWDGRMLYSGYNPYLHTPDSFIQNGHLPVAQAQELYSGMGALSSSHFTNYPPLNQFCFWLAALFSSKSILGSVVVMRLLIIAADFGTYVYGKKLLLKLGMPARRIYWYLLNPFIIIELTGNLHFEGVMVFFLIGALYYISTYKRTLSATMFALSVSVKLIPLMLLPIFFKRLGFGKLTGYVSLVVGFTVLGFVPFISTEFYANYAKTVGLWFQNFEFNASIYYILRELSYHARGYNEIAIIGKILPIIVVLIIAVLGLIRKNKDIKTLISSMVLVLTAYLFLSTTVHPWYLATLIGLSTFTSYRYPWVWSFAVFLSYAAYLNDANQENLYIIALEYAIVYSVVIYEVYQFYVPRGASTQYL